MRVTSSASPRFLLSLLAIALLAACGKHDDAAGPSSAADSSAASEAQEDAASTAKCEGNPLIKAMPPNTALGGLPFRAWECTFNSVHAMYGTEDGRQIDVTLTDTRSPEIDKQPTMTDFYHRTFDMQHAVTQSTVLMLLSTIDGYKSAPELAQVIGGPAYIPIAEPSATGEPFIIHAGRKDEQSPAEVTALFKDRHVVSMEAKDKGSAIIDLNATQAQALYEPFIKGMHPELLP